MDGFSASELQNVQSTLSADAEDYVNDAKLEMQWAVKAYEHAETYFKIISSIDPSLLKLTPADDAIYEKFNTDFPDCKIDVINEDEMKSDAGKKKWRAFCTHFEGAVADWNFATLLRLDCAGDVSENNTTIVPRIQFLAFEIVRNRRGCNSGLREKFGAKKST